MERRLLRTITNKIKKQKTNKPAYQLPTPVLFVLQLLLLVEFNLFFVKDNIVYIFFLFRNHLTSISCELGRLARYQPREFLSALANCRRWIFLAVKFAIVNKQLKQPAKRAF